MSRVAALLVATALLATACEEESRDKASSSPDAVVRIEAPDSEGSIAFKEGYLAAEQHLTKDGWSRPRVLPRDGVELAQVKRTGLRLRLWILPCDGNCPSNGRFLGALAERGGVGSDFDDQLIRCGTVGFVGENGSYRLRPQLVLDEEGAVSCHWQGSAVVERVCTPTNETRRPSANTQIVSPSEIAKASYRFVDRRGCVDATGGFKFSRARWSGSFDCNSSAGGWRKEADRIRMWANSSTTIACGGSYTDLQPEDVVRFERIEHGNVRLLDDAGFVLAVAVPVRDVAGAYDVPEGEPVAVKGSIIDRDGDARICSTVFSSLPPSCGDVGGKPGFVGSTMQVEDFEIDQWEPRRSGSTRWLDEFTMVGRRSGDTLTAIEAP